MSDINVNIFYAIQDGGWGGANQFLKALRNEFISKQIYTDNPENANIILFNAHHHANLVFKLKQMYPNKIFIHRMDGIYKLYNTKKDTRQNVSIQINNLAANATVFQNNWSKQEYIKDGFKIDKPHAIISNSVDNKIFNTNYKKTTSEKIRLVCTSWSTNKNKGRSTYKYLDNNLDFDRYSFTYIGKDPGIKFKNIKKIGPFNSDDIAKHLREYDIFITASKHDCCSNSLLEALSTGLPAVGLDSGGTPEIIGKAGELFKSRKEALISINKVAENIEKYRDCISTQSINEIAAQYISFFKSLINK